MFFVNCSGVFHRSETWFGGGAPGKRAKSIWKVLAVMPAWLSGAGEQQERSGKKEGRLAESVLGNAARSYVVHAA